VKSLTRKSLVLLIFVFLFGCGGDSTDPVEVVPGGVENAALSVNSIASMARVGVTGLPAAKAVDQTAAKAEQYEVVVSAEGADPFTLILDNDQEGWFFHAPLHPVTPNGGGSLVIRITDGTAESGSLDLDVGPLPEAPGAFASLVATMAEHLEQRAAMAGTSIAALKAMPAGEVPDALLSLKLAQSYLDSDSDPNDLTDLAANEDGFFSADEAELMDRVFGYFDLESLLRQDIDDWPVTAAGDLAFPSTRLRSEGKNADFCINAGPEIDTAPELSMAMIRSAVAQFGADPNSEAGRILEYGATILTGLSVVPEFGGPASAAGAAIGTVQAATQFVAGILPSSFTSIKCDVDKKEFNEDSIEFAKYSNVEVTAVSTGWSADKSIANVLINAFGSYLSFADKGQILGNDLLRDVSLIGLGQGASEVFGDTGIIEFCSQPWTVDISSPLYCTAAALSHKFDVDIEAQKVTPKEEGADNLRVAAQAPKFGGREIHTDVPMLVKKIMVDVTPVDYTVGEPGETVSIEAVISNADLTTLRWTPQWGTWEDGIGDDTNDGRIRPLKTPTDPDAYPFLVTVESLTRNGPRSSGLPPRVGFATIRYQDSLSIRIDPPYACIDPGDTLRFTAQVTGLEEYNVIWSVIEGYGSIDQDGLYHSLSGGTSNAVIQAMIEGHPDKVDEASLDAAACNCSLDINITGDATWQRQSSQAAYLVSYFDDYFYQFFFGFDINGPPLISASIAPMDGVPAPRPGDTGSWPVGFSFFDGAQSWSSIVADAPLPGVSVNITELTESYMTGTLTGNAFQLDDQGEISSIIGVDIKFRAGLWDGGAWPCE